ncbi:MAG: hypothetical protein H7Y36_04310 [Armatimonadetes bacterium]|nr:hypothetical protein [Akkermansiaceae bacterium]
MKKSKISLGILCLGAAACDPLPPYPPPYQRADRRPDSARPGPYYEDQARNGYRNDRLNDGPYNQDEMPPREQPREPTPTRDQYPVAERTDNPNQVLSPYAPYNVIDVEGFRSGQLAKDPSNGKIFRVP